MIKVVEQSCDLLLDFEDDNPACTFWVNLNKNTFSAEQLKKKKKIREQPWLHTAVTVINKNL